MERVGAHGFGVQGPDYLSDGNLAVRRIDQSRATLAAAVGQQGVHDHISLCRGITGAR
jgi:hypothetical protein